MVKVDAVFAGGGVKALAFIGALQAFNENNIELERIAGTSAGALSAAFIKAGYDGDEIHELFRELDMKKFLDPRPISTVFPFLKWVDLYKRMGLYKGAALERWLEGVLANKGIKTFKDIPTGTLKIIASDITHGNLIILPDDLPKYGIKMETFSVAKALRMSASLPFFFEPMKLTDDKGNESLIVDGWVLSNFPLWVFTENKKEKQKRPVIGLNLTPEDDQYTSREIDNSIGLLHAMFDAMLTAHDQRYMAKAEAENIIFIPVKNTSSTNFHMSDQEQSELIDLGKKSTSSFLSKWKY